MSAVRIAVRSQAVDQRAGRRVLAMPDRLGGLTYGAGLGGGLLLAGWLYGIYGADAYWSNAALSALALPVVLWLALAWRGRMMVPGKA